MNKCISIRCNAPGVDIDDFLKTGTASCGWDLTGDLSGNSTDLIRKKIQGGYPHLEGHGLRAPMIALCGITTLKPGDLVVVPVGTQIYIGKTTSEYYYINNAKENTAHRVNVDWKNTPILRDNLSEELREALKHRTTLADVSDYYDELMALAYGTPSIMFNEASYTLNLTYNGKRKITISGLPGSITQKTINEIAIELKTFYMKLGKLKE